MSSCLGAACRKQPAARPRQSRSRTIEIVGPWPQRSAADTRAGSIPTRSDIVSSTARSCASRGACHCTQLVNLRYRRSLLGRITVPSRAADASMRRVSAEVHGRVDSRFARVRDAFAHNFAERGELGASLCLIVAGRTAVDLWGGFADAARERPWREHTIVMV